MHICLKNKVTCSWVKIDPSPLVLPLSLSLSSSLPPSVFTLSLVLFSPLFFNPLTFSFLFLSHHPSPTSLFLSLLSPSSLAPPLSPSPSFSYLQVFMGSVNMFITESIQKETDLFEITTCEADAIGIRAVWLILLC